MKISRPFYLGKCEVSRGQFASFIQETGYQTDAEKNGKAEPCLWTKKDDGPFNWRVTGHPQTDDHPVAYVSWNDAIEFCRWLTKKEGPVYRLPTEAEWEYACRAGTTTTYWCGDDKEDLPAVDNVADLAMIEKVGGKPADLLPKWPGLVASSDGFAFSSPIGNYRSNPFGLHDMLGNVCEWCQDYYSPDYYGESPIEDPFGPSTGSKRVRRGGLWDLTLGAPPGCAGRQAAEPTEAACSTGFRVVREVQ